MRWWGGGECWHPAPHAPFFSSTESETFMSDTTDHALQRIPIESGSLTAFYAKLRTMVIAFAIVVHRRLFRFVE